ncbi:hypothetical protein DFH08DRAFT_984066 [Mycena albidolilacea]|uniref:Uncharacterized protein n=1 Tax=Mycena albidolilacea TaxID=1033008 RepID=A0AAD7F730_9AGAR|nr:hypothetical protein DFH08DRAFT_984066 [Mycena albidolilacea]
MNCEEAEREEDADLDDLDPLLLSEFTMLVVAVRIPRMPYNSRQCIAIGLNSARHSQFLEHFHHSGIDHSVDGNARQRFSAFSDAEEQECLERERKLMRDGGRKPLRGRGDDGRFSVMKSNPNSSSGASVTMNEQKAGGNRCFLLYPFRVMKSGPPGATVNVTGERRKSLFLVVAHAGGKRDRKPSPEKTQTRERRFRVMKKQPKFQPSRRRHKYHAGRAESRRKSLFSTVWHTPRIKPRESTESESLPVEMKDRAFRGRLFQLVVLKDQKLEHSVPKSAGFVQARATTNRAPSEDKREIFYGYELLRSHNCVR